VAATAGDPAGNGLKNPVQMLAWLLHSSPTMSSASIWASALVRHFFTRPAASAGAAAAAADAGAEEDAPPSGW
jgi:hypothetical protein